MKPKAANDYVKGTLHVVMLRLYCSHETPGKRRPILFQFLSRARDKHDCQRHGFSVCIVKNVGERLRPIHAEGIRPIGIAVFDPAFSVFDAALTTSCILFMQKTGARNSPILACKVGSIQETGDFLDLIMTSRSVSNQRYINLSSWNPADKWLNRILRVQTAGLEQMPKRAGDYFRCLR